MKNDMAVKLKKLWKKVIGKAKEVIIAEYNIFILPILRQFIIFKRKPLLFIWLFVSTSTISIATHIPLVFVLLLYIPFMLVAISSIGEFIIRILEDVRRVATKTEKERLYKLFDEVYERVKEKDEFINDDIKLYIVDHMEINAFAIGKNSIALSRGVLSTMSDKEIKGILAHEFAHISHGDTQLTMLIYFCTSVFLWIVIVAEALLKALESCFNEKSLIGNIIFLLRVIPMLIIKVAMWFWTLVTSGGSRLQEYQADEFALELGYGDDLKSALYTIYEIQMSDKCDLIKRIKMGHPRIAYRIEQLEEDM